MHCIIHGCSMKMSELSDMYTQSPRAADMHISQITNAHVTTTM